MSFLSEVFPKKGTTVLLQVLPMSSSLMQHWDKTRHIGILQVCVRHQKRAATKSRDSLRLSRTGVSMKLLCASSFTITW